MKTNGGSNGVKLFVVLDRKAVLDLMHIWLIDFMAKIIVIIRQLRLLFATKLIHRTESVWIGKMESAERHLE